MSSPTQFAPLVLALMYRSVILDARQRQALLDRYRKDPIPEIRFRAHILLLLDAGHTWEDVVAFLFCSSRTIDRWVKRFQREGVEGRSRSQARPTVSLRHRMARHSLSLGSPPRPHATSASCAADGAANWSPC